MGFSLLQSALELPALDNLRRAFRSVKCLTEFDAFTIARHAFGILVKNLSFQDAFTLQSALKLEGICTQIIEDCLLPELPQGKQVNRLDRLPEFLSIFDPLGRSFSLEWKHVMMITAGRVALNDFTRVVIERLVIGHDRFGKADFSKERIFFNSGKSKRTPHS